MHGQRLCDSLIFIVHVNLLAKVQNETFNKLFPWLLLARLTFKNNEQGFRVHDEISLSIVIITLNEERALPRCLESLPKGAEIVILDSGSTDNTVLLAKKYGASVYFREFDNYANQKNAALKHANRQWILSLDADEVLDEKIKRALQIGINSGGKKKYDAYQIQRTLVYMGKKLKFGKARDFPVRLFRKNEALFEGAIHEKIKTKGRLGCLDGEVLHYSYDNLNDYFARFNRYTDRIAQNHLQGRKPVFLFRHVFRPWTEFFYRYFFCLGFLDGMAGYSYALISSLYAFVKYEKLRELYLLEKRGTRGW